MENNTTKYPRLDVPFCAQLADIKLRHLAWDRAACGLLIVNARKPHPEKKTPKPLVSPES